MKIIALLDIEITSGGGFNQALSAILQMNRLCKDRFEFAVVTTIKENISLLNKFGFPTVFISISPLEKILSRLINLSLWEDIELRPRLRTILSFERKLINCDADIVYFVHPSIRIKTLRKLNYIITVWDLCHRDMPEFPEVRDYGVFFARERLYQTMLSPAVIVLTDSIESANNISRRYGIDPKRLLPMPFSQAPFLTEKHSTSIKDVLAKYELNRGYFFYPAQFWAHKNHIRVLEALLLLRNEGVKPIMVFAGSDKGNRKIVESFIFQYNLEEQVKILGFAPAEDMRGLYSSCRAVVMPTYFGPTNIPPLEAWMLDKPLIYSSHFREQAGNAAILIDPDDANDLAMALKACMDDQVSADLVEKGHRRLQQIKAQRDAAEAELLTRLERFEKLIKCWRAH